MTVATKVTVGTVETGVTVEAVETGVTGVTADSRD